MAKNVLSDDSTITIPVRNLISILGAVAISSWAYFGVLERLTSVERDLAVHWEEIEENDNWIDEFEPPASVQESVETVRELELQIVVMQYELELVRNHVNEMYRDDK